MRSLLLALCGTAAGITLGLMVVLARDWVIERRLVSRMRRSGERKRLAQTPPPVTWVVDDDGSVIDSQGNSWIVTG